MSAAPAAVLLASVAWGGGGGCCFAKSGEFHFGADHHDARVIQEAPWRNRMPVLADPPARPSGEWCYFAAPALCKLAIDHPTQTGAAAPRRQTC